MQICGDLMDHRQKLVCRVDIHSAENYNAPSGLDRTPFKIEQDAAIPLRNKGTSPTFLLALN